MDKIIEIIATELGSDFTFNRQGMLVWVYFKGKPVERFDLNYLKELDLRGELVDYLKNIRLKYSEL